MRELLTDLLESVSPPESARWLRERLAETESGFQRQRFYFAFSGVSRHFPKRQRVVAPPEVSAALRELVPDFTVEGWDLFRLARVLLLLALAGRKKPVFLGTLAALRNTADLREAAAIFSAYPLLPHPEELVESAVDGLRSNVVDIFDSIALNNSFPAQHFSEGQWNQMMLKAIFLNRALHRIAGLESRRNAALAAAISDLAHERWAAGRSLSPEAWRNCVGYVDDRIAADLHRLLESGRAEDLDAAALVLIADESGRLSGLRESLEGKIDAIGAGELTWDRLGERLQSLAQP